jgi:hypothetical protein
MGEGQKKSEFGRRKWEGSWSGTGQAPECGDHSGISRNPGLGRERRWELPVDAAGACSPQGRTVPKLIPVARP